jgi:nucleotide-binding universal stress UspA family protein
MIALQTILVAVDPTEPHRRVLARALALAAGVHASLHVLAVVSEPLHEPWIGYESGTALVDALDRERVAAHRRLERLVPRRAVRDGRITVATAWGEPAAEVVRYARSHLIDLIICGTHGRRGMNRLLMGSVAEQVLRTAPCPVLTVRETPPSTVAA